MRMHMAKKTIDATTVRQIAAKIDCDAATVRRVFKDKTPKTAVGRKIMTELVTLGFADPPEEE